MFAAKYTRSCGYLGTRQVLSNLWGFCDVNLRRSVQRCSFPWQLIMPALEENEMNIYYYNCRWDHATYQRFLDVLRGNLARAVFLTRVFRLFARKMVRWYRKRILVKGYLIARNKKDGLLDQILKMRYHPVKSTYFTAAFSGRFPKNLETMDNGEKGYVIHVSRMKTSQEAVALYCQLTLDPLGGRLAVWRYLDESTFELSHFEEVFQGLDVIATEFMDDRLASICSGFLHQYIEDTLLHKKGMNSVQRLESFLRRNPVLAEYIWKGNFATETQRATLGSQLDISKRNLGGFKRSSTLAELKEFVDRKLNKKDSLLDQLPACLWKKIETAENALVDARQGVRVGLYGRYISSDAITMAQTRVRDAWKEADRWIGRQLLQQSR